MDMTLINQFLDENGKYKTRFTTIDGIIQQKRKVSEAIKQTTSDEEFDSLVKYYIMLISKESEFIIRKEREKLGL